MDHESGNGSNPSQAGTLDDRMSAPTLHQPVSIEPMEALKCTPCEVEGTEDVALSSTAILSGSTKHGEALNQVADTGYVGSSEESKSAFQDIQIDSIEQDEALNHTADTGHVERAQDRAQDTTSHSPITISGSVEHGEALNYTRDTGDVESGQNTTLNSSTIQSGPVERCEILKHSMDTCIVERAEDITRNLPVIQSGSVENGEALNHPADTGHVDRSEDTKSNAPVVRLGSVEQGKALNCVIDQVETVADIVLTKVKHRSNREPLHHMNGQGENLHQFGEGEAFLEESPIEKKKPHARIRDNLLVELHEDTGSANTTLKLLDQKHDIDNQNEGEGLVIHGESSDVEMGGCGGLEEVVSKALESPKANINDSSVSNGEGNDDPGRGYDEDIQIKVEKSNSKRQDMTGSDGAQERLPQDFESPRPIIDKSSFFSETRIENRNLHPKSTNGIEKDHNQQLPLIVDSSISGDAFLYSSSLDPPLRKTEGGNQPGNAKYDEELKLKMSDEIDKEHVQDVPPNNTASTLASRDASDERTVREVGEDNAETPANRGFPPNTRASTPASRDSSTERAVLKEDVEMPSNQELPMDNRASISARGDSSAERAILEEDPDMTVNQELGAPKPERHTPPLESRQSTGRPHSMTPDAFLESRNKSCIDLESSGGVNVVVSPLPSPHPTLGDLYENEPGNRLEYIDDVKSDGDVSAEVLSVSSLRSGYPVIDDQSEDHPEISMGDETVTLSSYSDEPSEKFGSSQFLFSEQEDVSSSIVDEGMQIEQSDESDSHFGLDGTTFSHQIPGRPEGSMLRTEIDTHNIEAQELDVMTSSKKRIHGFLKMTGTEKIPPAKDVTPGEEKATGHPSGNPMALHKKNESETLGKWDKMQTEDDSPKGYNISCSSIDGSVARNKEYDEMDSETATVLRQRVPSQTSERDLKPQNGIPERCGNNSPEQDNDTQLARSPGKPAVEIIDLGSEDEGDIVSASLFVKIEPEHASASFTNTEDVVSGNKPIINEDDSDSVLRDLPRQLHERKDSDEGIVRAHMAVALVQNDPLDVCYCSVRDRESSGSPGCSNYAKSLAEEHFIHEQDSNLDQPDPGTSPQSFTPALEAEVLRDSRLDPIFRNQLFTPSASQRQGSTGLESLVPAKVQAHKYELRTPHMTQTSSTLTDQGPTLFASQQESLMSGSSVAGNSQAHDHKLPTPSLTQTSSVLFMQPTTPEQRPTPFALQQVTESPVPLKFQGHDQEIPTPHLMQISPTPPLRQTTPEQKPSTVEKVKAIKNLSMKKALQRKTIDCSSSASPWFTHKEPSQFTHVSDSECELESSYSSDQVSLIREDTFCDPPPPNAQNVPESPPSGFRTSLSYFAPLSSLPSHFNTLTSTLVIIQSYTPITRSRYGPRDYTQSLYLTDPSSASSPPTLAQIFRPNELAIPVVIQGDAILLRNFKVTSFKNRVGLLSTDSSAWAVFRKDTDVQIRGAPVEFGAEERGFARGLWTWWASVGTEPGESGARKKPVVMIENKGVEAVQSLKYKIHGEKTKPRANARDDFSIRIATRKSTRQQEASPRTNLGADAMGTIPTTPTRNCRNDLGRKGDSPSPKPHSNARGNVFKRTPTRAGTETPSSPRLQEASSSPKPRGNTKGTTPPTKNRTRTSAPNSSPNSGRHVLRDGTSYESTPEKRTRKPGVNYHELRDGTTYTDDVLRDGMSNATPLENKTRLQGAFHHELRDGTTYADDDGGGDLD